jgi:hypothetical protein
MATPWNIGNHEAVVAERWFASNRGEDRRRMRPCGRDAKPRAIWNVRRKLLALSASAA